MCHFSLLPVELPWTSWPLLPVKVEKERERCLDRPCTTIDRKCHFIVAATQLLIGAPLFLTAPVTAQAQGSIETAVERPSPLRIEQCGAVKPSLGYCVSTLASLITLCHFVISDLMKSANTSGDIVTTSMPSFSSLPLMSASFKERSFCD